MIDLTNTWIPNVNGELKELWVSMCIDQGIHPASSETLSMGNAALYTWRSLIYCNNNYDINSRPKEITLSDLKQASEPVTEDKVSCPACYIGAFQSQQYCGNWGQELKEDEPKPKRVNVSYEKVDVGIFDAHLLKADFEAKALYYKSDNGHFFTIETTALLAATLHPDLGVYREVEAELTWKEIIHKDFDVCIKDDKAYFGATISESMFLEMCRVVIAAVDGK